MPGTDPGSLEGFATYLAARREAVLNNWRTACQADPALQTGLELNWEEFNNKVPFMLNVFEQRLRRQAQDAQVPTLAAEHGLHRWQKGYALHELLREMQLLQHILLEEVRQYWQANPLSADAVSRTYELLADFGNQINGGSIEQYAGLQRQAAVSRVETLEKTLAELGQMSRQRGDLLRYSSHDLRSSFGVIQSVASLLELADESAEERQQMLQMLQRNLTTIHELVLQLMDLSRLEAEQEPLEIKTVALGPLLTGLLETYQPLAGEQGLYLKVDGPADLTVETDPLHLQRIVQNLVLNALKHTAVGGVSVSWVKESESRWILSVQDSGPGMASGKLGSLVTVLEPTAESTAAYGLANPAAEAREEAVSSGSRSPFASAGEGIGLSIVKRLSELLRGSLEVETKSGVGTLFRLRLPLSWTSGVAGNP